MIVHNIKGTTGPDFQIGKSGPVIHQGTARPLDSVGANGDMFICNSQTEPKNNVNLQKKNGIWRQQSPVLYAVNNSTVTITNSSASTDIFNTNILANHFKSDSILKLTILGELYNTSGITQQCLYNFTYGGGGATSLFFNTLTNASARLVKLESYMVAKNATNSQWVSTTVTEQRVAVDFAVSVNAKFGTSGVNSTLDKYMISFWKFTNASASLTFTKQSAMLELLNG